MVNNSTNINKTNNHLSSRESLSSDGQQFHQYHQYGQSLFTSDMSTHKIPRHMTLEIKVVAWDRHTNVVGLNRLMG
jgi:hypothetical protein